MPVFVVQLIIFAVAIAASIALAPKPEKPRPASLSDFDAPTAEEGRSIPVVFGTVVVKSPNVTWFGDHRSEKVRASGK